MAPKKQAPQAAASQGRITYNTTSTEQWLAPQNPEFCSPFEFIVLNNLNVIAQRLDQMQEQINYLAGMTANRIRKAAEPSAPMQEKQPLLFEEEWREMFDDCLGAFEKDGNSLFTKRATNKKEREAIQNSANKFQEYFATKHEDSAIKTGVAGIAGEDLRECFIDLCQRFKGVKSRKPKLSKANGQAGKRKSHPVSSISMPSILTRCTGGRKRKAVSVSSTNEEESLPRTEVIVNGSGGEDTEMEDVGAGPADGDGGICDHVIVSKGGRRKRGRA